MSRDSLWKILQICGVPQELSVLVRQLYTDTRSAVRLASYLSGDFTIETGVKQGCVIATDLFDCVIYHLMSRLLRSCSLGIQLGENQLTDLDYTDDIAIFAPSACVLQEALIIVQEESAGRRQNSWLSPQPHQPSVIEDMQQEVVFADSFTYI